MNRLLYIVLFVSLSFPLWGQQGATDDFWADIDFNDSNLVSNKLLENKLIAYLYQFTDAGEQHFDSLTIDGLDRVLQKAKANMRVYEFVLEFALRGYSGMGRDRVTDYLLNYPQLAEGEITMAEGMRLDSITEPYQKVRVGAKAPDFFGMTIDGKLYQLFDSQANSVIIVFWSTDCEYCHDFLKDIRRNLDLKSDYELVTFALADNVGEVRAQVKRMRLPGYHFFDEKRWDSKPFLDYHVSSTPTVFVLDEEKNIVCKPYDWMELKDYIKSHK